MTASALHSLVVDRYRLDELLAVGGMGEVWRATDTVLDRPVAVKTLKPEYAEDPGFRARFRAEGRHAAKLSHPGIASVYDFGERPEGAWLVMELVEGEPLSQLLHREGPLTTDRVLDLVAQTAEALQVAHDGGVVHRDIKPGNLMVRPDGQVTLTDFGIASATGAAPITQTGEVVGTAYYLSPEQVSGAPAGPASDLYALGVVTFECLAGTRPFPGDSPVAVAVAHLRQDPPPLPVGVPPKVSDLVERLLAKDPAARPGSAAAVAVEATALRQVKTDQATAVLRVVEPTRALPVVDPSGRVVPGADRTTQRYALRAIAVLLALLVVSLGLRTAFSTGDLVAVPGLPAGVSQSDAVATLAAAGLEARSEQVSSDDIAAGVLVRTDPMRGAEVAAGSSVLLVFSTGPASVLVTAASLVGLPAEQAEAALLAAGLSVRLAYDGVGQRVGTVAAVEPVGQLPVGESVLLRVVPPDRSAEQPQEPGDDGPQGKPEKKP